MLGTANGLAVVLEGGVGEPLDSRTAPIDVVVTLTTAAVVGQDGAEIAIGISEAIVIIRATAST